MRLAWFASLLLLAGLWVSPVDAASSINTTQPANGVPYSPAPIRNNFAAAANDINALQSLNAGPNPPSNPPVGSPWLQTSLGAIYTLWLWDGRSWDQIGAIDTTNHIWMPPIGGGVLPNIISGTLTDLGSFPQAALNVTGSNQITNLGSSAPAGSIKVMVFTGTPTLINSAALAIPGGNNVAQQIGDIAIALNLGASNWKILYDTQVGPTLPSVRTALTGNLNMYVNPSIGNDTNSCILPGAPCQTIQRALSVLQTTYDFRGFNVVINLAAGTYTTGALVEGIFTGQLNETSLTLLGNPSNPDSVVISDTRSSPSNRASGIGTPILVGWGGGLTINGMKLVAGYRDLWAHQGGSIDYQNVDFGNAAGDCQLVSDNGSTLRAIGNYTVSSGSASHECAYNGGIIFMTDPNNSTLTNTVTILNNPSYSLAFVSAQDAGSVFGASSNLTFSGTAVGSRYNISLNGVVSTNNSGTSFFPGTLPGVITSGGQYDNIVAQRTRFTSNLTMYVSPSGTDTNNSCLVQATPCQTIQNAANLLAANYDFNALTATIQLGPGTYSAGLLLSGKMVGQNSEANLILLGNVGTPDSVQIFDNRAPATQKTNGVGTDILAGWGGEITVQGVELQAGFRGLWAHQGSTIKYSAVDFNTISECQLAADNASLISAVGNYTISGSAQTHDCSFQGGTIAEYDQGNPLVVTITLAGTPAFSQEFALSQDVSNLFAINGVTVFSGSATGQRYLAQRNGNIFTNGGGANFFPGSTAGCGGSPCPTGGQYN